MAKVKLTETYLRKLEPGPGRHWDAEQPGLFVLSYQRGPVFYCKFGKDIRIGKVAEWTLEEAREKCRAIRRGEDDLSPERLLTVREAFDRFEKIRLSKRRPRTAVEYRQQMEGHVFPIWGDRPVDQISRADVVRLHHKLTMAGREVRANRVIATLSSLFNWLRRDGGIDVDNPAAGIERNQEINREVYLDAAQVMVLQDALAAYEARTGNTAATDCVLFCASTGCRSGEARAATWDQFDEALTTWHKPASTTKQKKVHRVPLGPAAQSVLLRRRGLRREGEDLVFAGKSGRKVALNGFWEHVRSAPGLPPDLRIHDLRHSFASLAISAAVPLQVVGGLLGHASQATTRRYAHLYDDDLRAAAGAVSAKIEGKREGGR